MLKKRRYFTDVLPGKAGTFTREISFSAGHRLRRADRILPVFLPFAGCPGHCVFCAQDKQTGSGCNARENLRESAACLEKEDGTRSVELAFFGGTFTALPPDLRKEALALYAEYHARGLLDFCRCSTRPDALTGTSADGSLSLLEELAGAGMDLVELGIQSFNDDALLAARRGYDGAAAVRGCRQVQEAGLKLGIQLLPGMPGVTPEIFLQDVDAALALGPDCLRFYPCLVPDGTVLADMWRRGEYRPWSEEVTVRTLGEGLRRAWQAGVPVLRLSVAPEASFDAILLDGPRHPALGSLIQAEALILSAEEAARKLGGKVLCMKAPRSCQGYLYGQKGALRSRWAAIGLSPENIIFTTGENVTLRA